MNEERLESLVIENFRSLRGKIAVPLNAQVVLIHGTNGMGKTSILSALELALTGKIAHLADDGDAYKRYLTTLGATSGSIALTPVGSHEDQSNVGSVSFSDNSYTPNPLLDVDDARFFAERCYLPQATLGRLLEIYDEQQTSSTSLLTAYVKELLGLDPLDALVDGLNPAFHVARVRRLAPGFHDLEALKSSLHKQLEDTDREINDASAISENRRTRISELLAEVAGNISVPPFAVKESAALDELRSFLETAHNQDRRLTDLSRARSEIRALVDRWHAIPSGDATRDQADKERADKVAAQALAAWRAGVGAELERAIDTVRTRLAELPSGDDDLEKVRAEALRRASAEESRCDAMLKANIEATERAQDLNTTIQRASSRVEELDKDLAGVAQDAKTLANTLASIVPHIHGDSCPVCDRDFADERAGPLSSHVAAKIAALTSEAGRLQALATERSQERNRIVAAQRALMDVANKLLSTEELTQLTVRRAQISDLARQLRGFESVSREGTQLAIAASKARQDLILARRRDELLASILPEIESTVQKTVGRSAGVFASIDEALDEALRLTNNLIGDAERALTCRVEALSEIERLIQNLAHVKGLQSNREHIAARLVVTDEALKDVQKCRDQAKRIAGTAESVRSQTVKKVFSTSLNKVWRDLFVRLAPSEQFVPAFKLPSDSAGRIEAVLETVHRSGQKSGPPGAMLSQGNLNTAALTLFLALHVSVAERMRWLVLDDPVQSMDDVHIAQFAALLRTLSKGMGRQIIMAVHERALFDYLTLELSPAFQGDSLITVEITRNFDGDVVATPTYFDFEEDHAIAA